MDLELTGVQDGARRPRRGDRHADGRRRALRARAHARVDRRLGRGAGAGVPARRGGRCRAGRRAHRGGRTVGSAPGHAAPPVGQVPVYAGHRAGGRTLDVLQRLLGRPDRAALPVRARPRLHDLRLRRPRGAGGGHGVADRGRGRRCATRATVPARRSCSSTAPTWSRRSPVPTGSCSASPGSSSAPGEASARPVRRRSQPAGVLRPRDAVRVRARRAPLRGRLVVRGPARWSRW